MAWDEVPNNFSIFYFIECDGVIVQIQGVRGGLD